MITLRTRGGLSLAADRTGPEDGAPVIFLHGGGQTRHSWGGALASLGAGGFLCTTIDLRGHGESDWASDSDYSLESLRDDLIDVLAQSPGGPPALVGASLGGLTSLLAAGDPAAPPVRALVLVDVVPQIEMEGALEIRAFMTANPAGFGSPDEAADAVAAYLPHRKRPPDNTGLLRNLRLREDGRWYWHWDPEMLQGSMHINPAARRAMLEEAAARVRVPTLLIRGGRSRVVSLEGVRALQAVIPHAEFVNIEDADHMVAGDANDRFNAPLLDFMERTR
jgi:non-heme chloroperoxidase